MNEEKQFYGSDMHEIPRQTNEFVNCVKKAHKSSMFALTCVKKLYTMKRTKAAGGGEMACARSCWWMMNTRRSRGWKGFLIGPGMDTR